MANPVKSFIDPVGVTRCYNVSPVNTSKMEERYLPTTVFQIWSSQPWSLICRSVRGPNPLISINAKLPPPPMGRLVVLTFPPIYKERKSSDGYPRVFPPMIVNKLWGSI